MQNPRNFGLQPPVLTNGMQNYGCPAVKKAITGWNVYLEKLNDVAVKQRTGIALKRNSEMIRYRIKQKREVKLNDSMMFQNFPKAMVKLSADIYEKWLNVQCFNI